MEICLRKTDRIKIIYPKSKTGYRWILKNTAKLKFERAAELIVEYLDKRKRDIQGRANSLEINFLAMVNRLIH